MSTSILLLPAPASLKEIVTCCGRAAGGIGRRAMSTAHVPISADPVCSDDPLAAATAQATDIPTKTISCFIDVSRQSVAEIISRSFAFAERCEENTTASQR